MRIKALIAIAAVPLLLAAIAPAAPAPVASAIVGTAPAAVTYNPVTSLWYVANGSTNDVSVLAGAGAGVDSPNGPGRLGALVEVARVPVGKSPQGIVAHPQTGLVFVSSYDTDSIWLIAGTTGLTSLIPVGHNPWAMAIEPSLNRLCVAEFGSSDVAVIDTTSRQVLARVPVNHGPTSVAAGKGLCWVTSYYDGSVQAIDLSNFKVTYSALSVPGRFDSFPRGVALSADALTLYVANSADSTLSFMNPYTGAVLTRVALDPNSAPIGVVASARTVYVTESALARIAFVNPAAKTFATRPTGFNPVAAAVSGTPECAAVTNLGSDSASLFCDIP